MISPGMFWLSAQHAPPRRKLCPDKLPSPWVTAFSFLSNTAPYIGKAGAFGDWWTAARSAWQTADTGQRGWGWRAGNVTLISRSRHWMVLDHRTQIVNEQSALSTKESLTPSPKQPFSFLGRLAINSYLALCQQESDSVACGSAWLTVHSGGWDYRVICEFPSSLQLKK